MTKLSKVERKHPDYLEYSQGVFVLVILIEKGKKLLAHQGPIAFFVTQLEVSRDDFIHLE